MKRAAPCSRRSATEDGSTRPVCPRRCAGRSTRRDTAGDAAFRKARSSPALHHLAYLPQLSGVVRRLLGPQAFPYPVKVLRAVYPEAPPGIARGRYVHQDYGVAGVSDMLTAWVPLMEIPPSLGGLAVHVGSHLGPPGGAPPPAGRRIRLGDGALSRATSCCSIASPLTPPFRTGSTRLRVSTDFRWQALDETAPFELIYGPAPRRFELYSRLFATSPGGFRCRRRHESPRSASA